MNDVLLNKKISIENHLDDLLEFADTMLYLRD